MVGEDGTGRGSIIAGEDKELGLSHCEVFKSALMPVADGFSSR